MITWFAKFWHAFFRDEVAFVRWMRAAGAGVAMVVVSILPQTGTDTTAMIAVIKGWSLWDWGVRLALGFLFSSVRGGGSALKAQPAP